MSCNGCRVLRKGCSESCILRPCLQWIESADAQGHATVFVAKFFGRSGLMGFISAVPPNQRPAVFQSLLYEACGRTVNPVFGAVGLLWAGNWAACQAAVETVLKGGSLRPPSPSSLGDAGITSFPSLGPGCPFPTPTGQEKSCPTEASGLSLANEKSQCFKKVREVMMEGFHTTRCGTNGSHQMEAQAENAESRPPMKGDVADARQWAWNHESNQSMPIRLDVPHVQLAGVGCMPTAVKSERLEERTDGPLVLVPVARRVRPRTEFTEVCAVGGVTMAAMVGGRQTGSSLEREQLELDLTLSSNVSAPRQQRTAHVSKGAKRVSSPNSSESVNSEGSVTSLDSTCDLSLSQVPPMWKSPKRGNVRPFSPPMCPSPRNALTLFACP